MNRHHSYRKTTRFTVRRSDRDLNRSGLRGRRRGPDDFAQMLTAYGRAIRAHRKLARLAPSFFDAAVVDRERENRAAQAQWQATWEPYLAKVYGVEPGPPDPSVNQPRLPPANTQRAVDRQLVELQSWLAAGEMARQRHQQRCPHALPTLTQFARLLQLAFDLKKMVLGLDSQNPLPDKIVYDYELTDLKRAYGHLRDPAPSVAPASVEMTVSAAVGGDGAPRRPVPPPEMLAGPAASVAPDPPVIPRRCDAWSRWARQIKSEAHPLKAPLRRLAAPKD